MDLVIIDKFGVLSCGVKQAWPNLRKRLACSGRRRADHELRKIIVLSHGLPDRRGGDFTAPCQRVVIVGQDGLRSRSMPGAAQQKNTLHSTPP